MAGTRRKCGRCTVGSLDNTRHYAEFKKVSSTFAYRACLLAIDMLLCIYPIMILNFKVFDLNNHWYFYCILLSLFSVIDPLFKINFAIHKIKDSEYKLHIFRVSMSGFIGLCAFVLSCLGSAEDQTTEQSNDIFFIIFSLFCFTKFYTLFSLVIMKNQVMRKSLGLVYQTYPFVLKISILYGLILIFFSVILQSVFGGKINSSQISDYQSRTGLTIRLNYHYLHFNDSFSSFLTLIVLLIQNNWVYVTEIMFFVLKDGLEMYIGTFLLILFMFLSSFVLTSLFFGIICRLIMFVFEKEFDFAEIEKQDRKKSADSDTALSESSAGHEGDENSKDR